MAALFVVRDYNVLHNWNAWRRRKRGCQRQPISYYQQPPNPKSTRCRNPKARESFVSHANGSRPLRMRHARVIVVLIKCILRSCALRGLLTRKPMLEFNLFELPPPPPCIQRLKCSHFIHSYTSPTYCIFDSLWLPVYYRYGIMAFLYFHSFIARRVSFCFGAPKIESTRKPY